MTKYDVFGEGSNGALQAKQRKFNDKIDTAEKKLRKIKKKNL